MEDPVESVRAMPQMESIARKETALHVQARALAGKIVCERNIGDRVKWVARVTCDAVVEWIKALSRHQRLKAVKSGPNLSPRS